MGGYSLNNSKKLLNQSPETAEYHSKLAKNTPKGGLFIF
jgi:hypothetical protein